MQYEYRVNINKQILSCADKQGKDNKPTSEAPENQLSKREWMEVNKLTSADKATTASITSAINEIKQEYDLSTEDIKAIAEFVQYIRTVHTAE